MSSVSLILCGFNAIVENTYFHSHLPSSPLGDTILLLDLFYDANHLALPPYVFWCKTFFPRKFSISIQIYCSSAAKSIFFVTLTHKRVTMFMSLIQIIILPILTLPSIKHISYFSPSISPLCASKYKPSITALTLRSSTSLTSKAYSPLVPFTTPSRLISQECQIPSMPLMLSLGSMLHMPLTNFTMMDSFSPLFSTMSSSPNTPHIDPLLHDPHPPIFLRKEKQCCTQHHVICVFTYDSLHTSFHTFALFMSFKSSSNFYHEAF